MLRVLKQTKRFGALRGTLFGVLLVCLFAGTFFFVSPALAQQEALQQLGESANLSTVPISVLIARIIRIFLGILGVIATVLIIYAGFLWMTAGGEEDKVKKAKNVLKQAVIGLLIIMSSYAIASFILNALLNATGLGGGVTSVADQYSEQYSGSLGAGAIEDHYPPRNAIDIPRNTMIFVTFKEPVNPSTIIRDVGEGSTGDLHSGNVRIYPTNEGPDAALEDTDVIASFTEGDPTVFVFDPQPLLGDGVSDMNYTVELGPGIEKADGTALFTGSYAGGYAWTFEIGTFVDLTPPRVTSVLPSPSPDPYAKNITVEMTFSEAMNPIAVTGVQNPAEGSSFSNLQVTDPSGTLVEGTWEIGNGYRTASFTPLFACGVDPCGDVIYCLPGENPSLALRGTAVAASVGAEPPQSVPVGVTYDGAVDAAGNSLDGNADGVAQGSATDASEAPDVDDNFSWEFLTSNELNDTVPKIERISPGIESTDVDPNSDMEFTFTTPMKTSTLSSSNIQLWPDPWYEFWFTVRRDNLNALGEEAGVEDVVVQSRATVQHPSLVSAEDAGWDYYPMVTHEVKSAYQICMYPAVGPSSGTDTGECANVTDANRPYCCSGSAFDAPGCQVPKQSAEFGSPIYLPDSNPETNPLLNE